MIDNNMIWSDKTILITGGTGSFGRKCVEILLSEYKPKKIIIFSRDELKQHDMRQQISDTKGSSIRFFIGDIRDKERLYRAFYGVDIVIHAAALKQVPACEYNPFEAILTNVIGAKNIIDAAIDQGVQKVIALSTDKAANPINLYGATKLCSEKLFINGNAYTHESGPVFSCTRYGNVIGSRGSVIPLFIKQKEIGKTSLTDPRMTRFWITLEQGVRFVINAIEKMKGGEIFIPKIPSMKVLDLAEAITPNNEIEVVGIRPGEKLHEILITEDEARHTIEFSDYFIIMPESGILGIKSVACESNLPEGFYYSSENNPDWLGISDFSTLIK